MSDTTASGTAPEDTDFHRLAHFPITFFAIVMGLMGLVLALHSAHEVLPWVEPLVTVALFFGVAVFAVIALFYVAKILRHRDAVLWEWNHPVRLAFFPAMSISLLLMAVACYANYPQASHALWAVGTIAQGVLTVAVVSGWISHRSFEVGHLTPAWFIPAVGNIIVPVVGVRLGYPEISWLFFSGGLVFWIVLLTLVMNRMVFHNPIPARLFPTLLILIAPPAVGFISYIQLVGKIDPFGHILMNTTYVFAALILVQVPKLLKLPFALSWWALSFPVAALTIASFVYARLTGSGVYQTVGLIGLTVLAVIIAGLLVRTVIAIGRHEICQPE